MKKKIILLPLSGCFTARIALCSCFCVLCCMSERVLINLGDMGRIKMLINIYAISTIQLALIARETFIEKYLRVVVFTPCWILDSLLHKKTLQQDPRGNYPIAVLKKPPAWGPNIEGFLISSWTQRPCTWNLSIRSVIFNKPIDKTYKTILWSFRLIRNVDRMFLSARWRIFFFL